MKSSTPSPEVLDAFESIKLIAVATVLLAFIPFAAQGLVASFFAREYASHVHLRTVDERTDDRLLRAFASAKRSFGQVNATLSTEPNPKQDTRDCTLTVIAPSSRQTKADASALRDALQAAYAKEGAGQLYDMDHDVWADSVQNPTMALARNICLGLSLAIVLVGLFKIAQVWRRQALPPLAILGIVLTLATIFLGSGRGSSEIIGWLFLAGIPAGLLGLLTWLTWRVRKAAAWAEARAKIVDSRVKAQRHRISGETTRIKNEAAVVYEFEVDGQSIRSDRISLGLASADNVDETMRKYPKGSHAPVYYDPANPQDCVLERNPPASFGCLWGGAAVGLVLYIGAIACFWKGPALDRSLTLLLPRLHHPVLTICLGGFGLFCLASAIYHMRHPRKAFNWIASKGRIVSSKVESYLDQTDHGHERRVYKAVIEFTFEAEGQEYHNNIAPGFDTTRASAEAQAAKYSVGQEVDVYYDPKNPTSSGLNVDTNMMLDGRASLVVALALLAAAVAAALH